MAQPKAMSESPRLAVEALEEGGDLGGRSSRASASRGRAPGGYAAVALGDERAVVVVAVLDAEALGQAPAPGPLLAGGLVAGPGHDVVQRA